MPDTLFTQSATASVLTIGVGSTGARVAKAAVERADDAPCSCWSAAHTDAAELIATGLEHKFLIETGDGPCELPDVFARLAESESTLAALTAARSTVVLIAALGERSTEILLPPLAKLLREAGLFVCIVGSLPTPFDGAEQAQRAALLAKLAAVEVNWFIPLDFSDRSSNPGALVATMTEYMAHVEYRLLAA